MKWPYKVGKVVDPKEIAASAIEQLQQGNRSHSNRLNFGANSAHSCHVADNLNIKML